MTQLFSLDWIDAGDRELLAGCQVTRAEDLIRRCAHRAGRMELSCRSGIPAAELLVWVSRADLYRIRGLSPESIHLLSCAGVNSMAQLAAYEPGDLHNQLVESAWRQGVESAVPALDQVEEWVAEANCLPRVVEF